MTKRPSQSPDASCWRPDQTQLRKISNNYRPSKGAPAGFAGLSQSGGTVRPPPYTVNTCTWHIGFLPQRSAIAARTARRSASATLSGSRLRPRGSDSKVSRIVS
jgi:hypothetical protein